MKTLLVLIVAMPVGSLTVLVLGLIRGVRRLRRERRDRDVLIRRFNGGNEAA